ncbi:MAG: phosphoribosyltransferase [Candidatus Marsarchaeota archaeon]|nr:phosphoribosyltransferase [Candidatus Marsarchaeota archaeon]
MKVEVAGASVFLRNRREAGSLLAERLPVSKYSNALVLAIPRGGIVIGCEIAERIGASLDIVAPRKLRDPTEPELAIGAVMHDGSLFLNQSIIMARQVSIHYIEQERKLQMQESRRRLQEYRNGKEFPRISGTDIILTDDGIATGATIIAAARWLRAERPRRLTLAVPVIPLEITNTIRQEVDDVIYLDSPAVFYGIGQFYRSFEQVTDTDVKELLQKYWESGSTQP